MDSFLAISGPGLGNLLQCKFTSWIGSRRYLLHPETNGKAGCVLPPGQSQETIMHFIDRREFFRTSTAIVAGALFLPKKLLARNPGHSMWFLQNETQSSWSITDPVEWCLQNASQPILKRASEGLRKLTPNDGERIIRLVVRRCSLNLLEIHPGQLVVHKWGQHRADLRPFFKVHGLARPEIEVLLRERKKEVVTTQHGDDFLYGDPIASDSELVLFRSKWVRRFVSEQDDWTAAPRTRSGYAWDRLEANCIPWAAPKSAWRRFAPGLCLNCDKSTILTNFGLRPVGLCNRAANFVSVCGACRRSFLDETLKDVRAWIVANLDAEVRPGSEMIWDRRVKWGGKARES